MEGQLYFVTTRHEKKASAPGGVKIVPGGEIDQRLPLSWAGLQSAIRTGEAGQVVPKGFDGIVAYHSTLVRTRETLQGLFAGAGYDPDNANVVKWQAEDPRIGLACGADFEHPSFPKYAPDKASADAYVSHLLREHWGPNGPAGQRFPVMAGFAYALLDNLVGGIESALPQARDGAKVVVAQATHAPLIDALDAALYQTIVHSPAGIVLSGFPGNYEMGMNISGKAAGNLNTDNPIFVFKGHSQREAVLNLDDLKSTRDRLYTESDGGKLFL